MLTSVVNANGVAWQLVEKPSPATLKFMLWDFRLVFGWLGREGGVNGLIDVGMWSTSIGEVGYLEWGGALARKDSGGRRRGEESGSSSEDRERKHC
jgi:hypothetical protein